MKKLLLISVSIIALATEIVHAQEPSIGNNDQTLNADVDYGEAKKVKGKNSKLEETKNLRSVPIHTVNSPINNNTGYNNPVSTNIVPSTSAVATAVFGLSPFVGLKPKRYKYGEISIIPTLSIGTGYNNNLGLRNTNTTGSILYYANPNILSYVQKGPHQFSLEYDGHFYRYPSSTLDDRQINTLALSGKNGFTRKTNMTWSLGYTNGAEERGLRDDSRFSNQIPPNQFKNLAANAKFQYGSTNAKGVIIAYLGYSDKTYTNNRTITQAADYENLNYGGEFRYRVAPKTYLTVGLNRSDTDYKQNDALLSLDNIDDKYTVGVRWKARAKTTLELQVGRQNKKFKDNLIEDQSGSYYRLIGTWTPLSYSKIRFYASQENIAGTSAFITNGASESNVIDWQHQWNESLESNFRLSHIKTDYNGADIRTDETQQYNLSLMYKLKHNIGIGLNYNRTNRDSNIDNFSYDLNVLSLTAHLSQ